MLLKAQVLSLFKKTSDNAMSNEDNYSSYDEALFCDISNFETITGAIYIFIFVVSITGNFLVLGVILFSKKLRNLTGLYVLNLACSDLVFTLTLPFYAYYQIHHWVFGEYACKLVTAAYFIGVDSSVILLTAITVDRFITVVLHWPQDPARRKRFVVTSCAAAWIISAAGSVYDAMKVKVETKWNLTSCEDLSVDSEVNAGYYLHVSLLFFLPFTIIVVCYSLILKTVLRAYNRRTQTVVMILSIVAFFFICWGPYNILLLTKIFYEPHDCYSEEKMYVAYSIFRVIAYSHCCVNPLLYIIPRTVRKQILNIFCTRISGNNERAARQNTTTMYKVAFTVQNSPKL